MIQPLFYMIGLSTNTFPLYVCLVVFVLVIIITKQSPASVCLGQHLYLLSFTILMFFFASNIVGMPVICFIMFSAMYHIV